VSLLEINELEIRYDGQVVVDNASFMLKTGETVGLVGESGSGKSQTALAIMGLLPGNARSSGSIRFDGKELLGMDRPDLERVRGSRIAMVFQDPMQALNPFVSIGAQLTRVLEHHERARGAGAKQQVIDMLDRVGLPDAKRQFRSYPHELSGGMRQRALIAAALLGGPELLVADEPTTALDVTVQAQILDLLEDIREDMSLLLITHDLGVIAGRCDRMVVLERGSVVEQGATRDVFAEPQHDHTRALIDAAPRIDQRRPPGASSGAEVLSIDKAKVTYDTEGETVTAVSGVSISICSGETLAIVGESGSGKTSLVRAALGLVPMTAGRVVFCGAEQPAGLRARDLPIRRGVQLVFQDPVASLSPRMRVCQVVAEPLLVHEPTLSGEERHERAATMLQRTGLGKEFLERYPHELSGGQAQRVAIARALVLDPAVLVCDEAVAALDGTIREQILSLLADIQARTGLAILFITHDLAVVRSISHRVLVMYLGNRVELAPNEALFASPGHPYTRSLLDAVPVPDPDNPGGRTSVQGEVPSATNPPPGCLFHPRCPHARDRCRTEVPTERSVGEATVSCHFAEELASLRH
jgi:oligopeptide/dipeptide ABC transporter ATP-binding protein